MSMLITSFKRYFVLLLLALLVSSACSLWAAAPAEGVNDDEIATAAILITAQDTEPSKNAHFCTVSTDRNGQTLAIEVLLNHSKEPDQDIEAFRIYQDSTIITKFLTKPEWHPYHFIAYLNGEKFPAGTQLILVTNCNVDGPYKQEFVVR